eukprot:13445511-Heterocapsa_arctica.AAC.1
MVRNKQRYINFWVYVTVYEEMEARGGKLQKLGFKFCRDWGNETNADYMKYATHAARKKGIIDEEDYTAIMKYNNKNLGNILEAIMGYSWISHYKKQQDLMEFAELANFL